MAVQAELAQTFEWFDSQLRETIDFWLSKSVDYRNGGYYNCLSSTGEIYDRTKYGWLQGRQVWMFAKLYNEVPEYHRTDILDAAIKGGEFLLNFIKVKNETRCYFAVTETGLPVHIQRKPYTECFYTIALSELYKATTEERYMIAAEEMLQQLIYWICFDDSGLGRLQLQGSQPTREMGYPMMLLNVLSEVCCNNSELREKYSEQFKWSIEAILQHHDGQWVHEHVLKTGGFPEGSLGRLSTPGHAIEGGWFLLQEALICDNMELCNTAIKQFIEMPYGYGWDKEYSGLYYFLDKEGYSPIQLEWSMKLWWVHCEALIALLMAYQCTMDPKHWIMFKQVLEYTVNIFPDGNCGEWFGYFTREGKLNQSFKGGPFKGCFHVPRCLYLCRKILKELQIRK